MKKAILILLAVMATVVSRAGTINDELVVEEDTTRTELPDLSALYYHDVHFLSHDYQYEKTNKQRRLRQQALALNTLGSGMILLVSFVGASVASNAGWSDWVSIPCVIVVSGGTIYGLSVWSNHLRKKADAIDVSSAYILPLGKKQELGIASFSNHMAKAPLGIGISLKTSF